MTLHFRPAAAFSFEALAALYTQTFEGYFYASSVSAADLAGFCRIEQLDLYRSPVLCDGDEPVALATVGLRADQAYCKGFGVIPAYRGRGLALELCLEMVRQARQAGARRLALGVMQAHERAVRTYRRVGMYVERELLSLEWAAETMADGRQRVERTSGAAAASEAVLTPVEVRECSAEQLLAHFAALHQVKPLWSRDLPSLLARTQLVGAAVWTSERPAAYVLFECKSPEALNLVDLVVAEPMAGATLLATLQREAGLITCHNEPEDSPALAALQAAGFRVTMRSYEMAMTLG